jgi:hypothetical protein
MSTGIALLWLPERLFVCLKQKVVLAYLISKPATKALLVNSSGIYTLKQTQCGFAGFTIFYLRSGTVWSVQAHSSSSPLWKAIISVRDLISQHCEDSEASISLMSRWSSVAGPFLRHTYNFFRPVGFVVPWNQVVWE